MSRALSLVLLAVALPACGAWHNARRFVLEPEYAAPDPGAGELAGLRYDPGVGEEQGYEPAPFEEGGVRFGRAVPIEGDGWIEVAPERPVLTEVFIRRTGVNETAFLPVQTVTGTIGHRVAVGVRYLPTTPSAEPLRLAMKDLRNPYNSYRFEDRDLLLLVVSDEERVERYLFQLYELGVRVTFGGGVLVPTRIPGLVEDVQATPALVGTASLGYRFRSRSTGSRLAESFSLVASAGVGSTALQPVEGAIEEQITGAFNAAVVGGGVALFDFLSLQGLVNVSALFREGPEARWVPVVGFDAVSFARYTRRAWSRLVYDNSLEEPPR